ncbi:cytochrome P450 [Rickenella mellea]|uniref:Cytochrome P450 n=1 Tax=Rickenella mellea TaxID=50990 RepID=A0A4Y7PLP5_9AGAM|nr:cytochrome P450 [Rickenella mellea]
MNYSAPFGVELSSFRWSPTEQFSLSSPSPSFLAGGIATSFVLFYLVSFINTSRKGKLPPGPKGIPFFGNLFQLTKDAWIDFTEWKSKYGDLIYITVAGQGMLILNSHKVAADLLDRRAAIYSDRPRLIVASEILTGGVLIPFARYSDVWRRMRRASHEGLNNNTARDYYPAQLKESALLIDGVLKDSNNWDDELKRAAVSMILGVVYDKPTIENCHDPSIARVNDFIARIVRAAFPGAHYAEYFRWMKYLPPSIAKWKREALEWYHRDSELFGGMYNDVKEQINKGEDRPSFAATLIRDDKKIGMTDIESSWLAATIYTTGAETTSTVMAWFVLAMVTYPEVQKKAQEELDAVVGRSRMPTFADRDHLPYIVATVRESLRWKTAAPVGVPHQSTEDDWYDGYFIPKGTICLANIWSMNKDPDVYGPDAEHFNPSRHLDKNGQLAPAFADTKDGEHFHSGSVFCLIKAYVANPLTLFFKVMSDTDSEEGTEFVNVFHRTLTASIFRICVGRHVANNSVFIDVAALLWATKIEPIKDAQGQPIMPDTVSTINDGLVLRPVPFKCSITPRFPDVPAIVEQTKELGCIEYEETVHVIFQYSAMFNHH